MCNHAAGRCSAISRKTVWDKPIHYVTDEVKRALRRSRDTGLPVWLQRARVATLNESYKRLGDADLVNHDAKKGEPWNWSGPKAAEQYVIYRRAQLGLKDTD